MFDRAPAPGDLALVERFLGTRNEVTDVASLRSWLVDEGFRARPAPADLERFLGVREAIRDLAAAHNGGPDPARARSFLDETIDSAGVRPRIGPGGELAFDAGPGSRDPLAPILSAMLSAMADGSWSRMKACAAEDCRFAFFDASRNRSARWCDVAGCGARHRMREYRLRHAGPA